MLPGKVQAVVGLDLSVTSTGVCVYDGDGTCNVWRISAPGHKGMARLEAILTQVDTLLTWAKSFGEILVVIEGYGMRGGENAVLVELGGVVRYHLFKAETPYVVVPPSSLKKFVTGKGNATKVMVCQFIERRYGRSFIRTWAGKDHPKKPKPQPDNWGNVPGHWNNDEADAFALAHLGYALTYGSLPGIPQLTNYENEVLEGIRLDPKGELLEEEDLRKTID